MSVWSLYTTRELAHILHQLDQKQRLGGTGRICRCRRCHRVRLGAEEPGYLSRAVEAVSEMGTFGAAKKAYAQMQQLVSEASAHGDTTQASILDEMSTRVDGALAKGEEWAEKAGRTVASFPGGIVREAADTYRYGVEQGSKGLGTAAENLLNPSTLFMVLLGAAAVAGGGYLLLTPGGQKLLMGGGAALAKV